MADESEGPGEKLTSALLSFIPKEMREMIGLLVGVYLFILTPMVLLGGAFALQKWFKEPREPDKQCWQLQKVDDRVFKVNTCTGETAELPSSPSPPPASK